MTETAPTKWYAPLLGNPKALVQLLLFFVALVGYDLTVPAQRAADAVQKANDANAKLDEAFSRLNELEKLLKDVKVNQVKLLDHK